MSISNNKINNTSKLKDNETKKKITSKKTKPKRTAGSKGKYQKWLSKEGLLRVSGWAMDGLSDIQIVKNIGISQSTYYSWVRRFPQFSEAIKKSKEVVDREVENALLKRALGFDYEETKTIVEYDEQGRERKRIERNKRYMAPDVGAIIFWLKNRKSEAWRNDDRVLVENNEDAINIHQKTIAALQNRKVKGFNDND